MIKEKALTRGFCNKYYFTLILTHFLFLNVGNKSAKTSVIQHDSLNPHGFSFKMIEEKAFTGGFCYKYYFTLILTHFLFLNVGKKSAKISVI